jgi:hypothetical protein
MLTVGTLLLLLFICISFQALQLARARRPRRPKQEAVVPGAPPTRD